MHSFSQNESVDRTTDIDISTFNGEVFQYPADNADHNNKTLDGKDSFHALGIVVSVTPLTSRAHLVPRRKSINAVEISAAGYVQIVSPPEPRFSFNLQYKNIDIREIPDPCSNIIIF